MTGSRLLWERWAEADAIISAAQDLPEAEREAYVRQAVPEPGDFRDLIFRLVDLLESDHARVELPGSDVVASAFGDPAGRDVTDIAAGTLIGQYVIAERLARGGMATVYLAERADGAYRQRVALKVLRRGLDTDDLIRRFRNERQILSSLTHPNIAKLLDGGALPDGRPYLVMELVEGRPITEHADQRRLDLHTRLQLFLDVADAVHAAHSQLVVHRDIKPSNILVDGEGGVRLLDFGIAKLLAEDTGHTEAGLRPLTPGYASPEQRDGGPITTATDVFQLGLLLRELLTGVPPVTTRESVGDTGLRPSRLASRSTPGIPSPVERARARSTTPERLARGLRGDLDLLVGKAIRLEPDARYASAREMAADVRRFLEGRPLLAHPESVRYRGRKFLARHRWGVAAASVVVALLVGYVLTALTHARRIEVERDRAEREARKAGEVTEFMVDLFHAADPNRAAGADLTVREVLDDGARRLREGVVEDAVVRASMLTAIGRSYSQLGYYQEAQELLERAVEAQRAGGQAEGRALASSLALLAKVVFRTDRARGLSLYEEALRAAEDAGGPDSPQVATLLTDYSVALAVRGDDPRVEAMRTRAVEILRASPGDVRGELANALTVSARGKPAEVAIPLMREALDLRRAIHPIRHSAVAASLSDLALVVEAGDPLAADSLLAEAVSMLRSIHRRPEALLLTTMNNLAALRRDRGAFDQAEPLYREVLELRRQLYPEQRLPQAYTLHGLGVVLAETGRAREGEIRLTEALTILQAEVPSSPLVALTQSAIGQARTRQGRFPDAERMLLPAWASLRDSPIGSKELARVLARIVTLYDSWGREAQAAMYRRQLDSLVALASLPASR